MNYDLISRKTGLPELRRLDGRRGRMKLWIKDIDWDRISYTQEIIDESNIEDYCMWVENVAVVVQSIDRDVITLLDRKGDPIVRIDSDAFSSMEVLGI